MSLDAADIDPFSELAQSPAESLHSPLSLPCGVQLKNRFFKAAMSENLAQSDYAPGPLLADLYRRWAAGGAAVLVTGSVMVTRDAVCAPRCVALEDGRAFDRFVKWAQAGKANDTHIWMQLSHPGKQIAKIMSANPLAPSSVQLESEFSRFFNPPMALKVEQIDAIVRSFSQSATIAKKAGFTGVQIQAAHGYLVSQFLSARHNRRDDMWGGSINNRMRFLKEIYFSMRAELGDKFPISIKLNCCDFQKGGLSEQESLLIVSELAEMGVDLIEISGGTLESPVMSGVMPTEYETQTADSLAKNSEAYFLDFVSRARKIVDTPLVVTGGFRSAEAMADAVSSGKTDMVGLARLMSIDPNIPQKVLAGEYYEKNLNLRKTGIASVDKLAMLEVTWYRQQLVRIAKGKAPKAKGSALASLIKTMLDAGVQVFRRQRA